MIWIAASVLTSCGIVANPPSNPGVGWVAARGAVRAPPPIGEEVAVKSKGRLGLEVITLDGFQGACEAPFEVTQRALTFGTHGDVVVQGRGIGPAHFAVHVDGDRVLAASGYVEVPAYTEHGMIPAAWVELPMPCRVLMGDVVVNLFWCVPRARRPRPNSRLAKTVKVRRHTSVLTRWMTALFGTSRGVRRTV